MTVSESRIKALSHGAIFFATCIAILLYVTNVLCVKNILATCRGNMYLPILHLSRVDLCCKLQENCTVRQGI